MSMTKTKREKLEMRSLTTEEIAFVTGGVVTGGAGNQPVVVIKPPADPAETYCGTRGPGVHIPSLNM
jgi:hypothetical protein